jgi:hypothetical protein
MKAPVVNINGVANNTIYTVGSVPTPSCTTVDSLSGPDGCSGVLTGGSQNGIGTYKYTATGRDKAGNTATSSATFQVQYVFSGFMQPINDTAHQTGLATSIFKAGSTVPVKFKLTNSNGALVTPNSAPKWVTPVRGAPLAAAVDENAYGGVSTTGDTYRTGDPDAQYIYNWSTKGLAAGYYYRVGVQLDDGTTYTVNIGLR